VSRGPFFDFRTTWSLLEAFRVDHLIKEDPNRLVNMLETLPTF